MRYKILCLYTGLEIKLSNINILKYCDSFVCTAMNKEEIFRNMTLGIPTTVTFSNIRSAEWFIRRRLSYNAKRSDYYKLQVMNQIFELNGLDTLTSKVEYEVIPAE